MLALVKNEADFIAWNKKLDAMDRDQDRYRDKASVALRKEINDRFFARAQEFMGRIGVTFGTSKGDGGRQRLDPKRAVVPDWDLDRVRPELDDPGSKKKNRSGGAVSLQLCGTCAHCDLDNICLLGRPNQASWTVDVETESDCDVCVALSDRVQRLKAAWLEPTKSGKNVGEKTSKLPENT